MSPIKSKKRRAEPVMDDGDKIAVVEAQVLELQQAVDRSQTYQGTTLFSSKDARVDGANLDEFIEHGMNPRHAKELLVGIQQLDVPPRLNTSSVSQAHVYSYVGCARNVT